MPVGARYSPNTARSVVPHSPVVTPALAQAIDGSMTLRPSLAARSSSASAFLAALPSRAARQALRRSTCSASMPESTDNDRAFAGGQRRSFRLRPAVDADHDLLAGLDPAHALGVALDQRALHVVDGRHRAAHGLDAGELLLGRGLELVDLAAHDLGAVEDVGVLEEVGLVGEDLLHAERPLLVPGARQAQRLVPGGQLHGARARVARQRHRQHLEQDAIDVVLGLRLGEAQRVDLHAVAEQAVLGIGHAVALGRDLVPQLVEGAHLADLGDEPAARR